MWRFYITDSRSQELQTAQMNANFNKQLSVMCYFIRIFSPLSMHLCTVCFVWLTPRPNDSVVNTYMLQTHKYKHNRPRRARIHIYPTARYMQTLWPWNWSCYSHVKDINLSRLGVFILHKNTLIYRLCVHRMRRSDCNLIVYVLVVFFVLFCGSNFIFFHLDDFRFKFYPKIILLAQCNIDFGVDISSQVWFSIYVDVS